jgi:hypothetical protein
MNDARPVGFVERIRELCPRAERLLEGKRAPGEPGGERLTFEVPRTR